MDLLLELAAICEILSLPIALGMGYLTWAAGYIDILIRAARRNRWGFAPREEREKSWEDEMNGS